MERTATEPDKPQTEVDLTDFGQAILNGQPFSRLIGARLSKLTRGSVELTLAIRDDLRQQHGFAHGGLLSYLADNALTFAGGTELGVDVVTSEMKINYVRPALGEMLIARAWAVSAGRSQAVSRCDVFVVRAGTEKLCAVAQGTITAIGEPSPLGR